MSREEAMRRHPSYRSRVSGLVSEARWQQAQDLANRLLVHAEEYSGGPVVPESPEVRQARQDDEAVALANSGRPRLRFPEWVYVLGLAVFGYGLLLGVLAAAALVEAVAS